jgi:hypothetical protein
MSPTPVGRNDRPTGSHRIQLEHEGNSYDHRNRSSPPTVDADAQSAACWRRLCAGVIAIAPDDVGWITPTSTPLVVAVPGPNELSIDVAEG